MVDFEQVNVFLVLALTVDTLLKLKNGSEQYLSLQYLKLTILKVNDGNTKTIGEICSKLTIKTPEQHNNGFLFKIS